MFRNTNKSERTSPSRRPLRAAVAPVLEAMEPRRMFDASLDFGNHQINIFTETPGEIAVWADATLIHTKADGQHDTFLIEDVAQILIGAGETSQISIVGSLPKPVTINGSGGNDIITIGSGSVVDAHGQGGNDLINDGSGNNTLRGGAGNDTINGGGGNDDIYADENSFVDPHAAGGNDIVHGGAGKDFIDGGPGQDQLFGDADNDGVSGGEGFDTLDGGTGNDHLMATDTLYNPVGWADLLLPGPGADEYDGDVDDTLDYHTYVVDIKVSTDNVANDGAIGEGDDVMLGRIIGGNGNDVLNGVGSEARWLFGAGGNDTIYGSDGNDYLDGGVGNDLIDGRLGADAITGGAGSDTASYAARVVGVKVTLDNLANDGQAGEFDNVLYDIEEIRGGQASDTLEGDANNNRLYGNGGGDFLRGYGGGDILSGQEGNDVLDGGFGADTIVGGAGKDAADYSNRLFGVFVSLDNLANDGAGELDNVWNDVENVHGGAGDDVLTGSSASNALYGNGGNDTLRGLEGSDELYGGNGVDLVTYGERLTGVHVTLDSIANDGRPANPRIGDPGEMDFVSAERIDGSLGDDVLIGDAAANGFNGYSGNDWLAGNGGSDTLSGGTGNDTLTGGADSDVLYGGDGDDRFFTVDSQADTLYGGTGIDTVSMDGWIDWGTSLEYFV